MFLLGLILPVLLALTPSPTRASSLSVSRQAERGTIHGRIDEARLGTEQFLGIPFAEPPIGARRWLPPIRKVHRKNETVDASRFGPSCPQYAGGPSVYNNDVPEFVIRPGTTDEDCLSLNIWAPAQGKARPDPKFPVIIWLYGGGFQAGGGAVEYQLPFNWVERSGKHIVVTINYRVNIFGFPNAAGLNSSELNLGLLDQRLGIEWIRDNIHYFGGNSSQMALWGQSAGAASVDYYNHAYAHDPIVSSLIMDSGNAFVPIATDEPSHASFTAVASHFNCSTEPQEQLACLRKVPYEDIENFIASYSGGTPSYLSFNPVVDDRTKFANYTQHTLDKKSSGLPAIMGTNANEGVSLVPYPKDPDTTAPNQTEADALTLNFFLCPAEEATKLRYQVGAKTYQYLYAGNYSNVSPRKWLGAYHSSELPLIMGTSEYERGDNTDSENRVSKKMQDLWVAFASDPTKGLEKHGWPAYKPGGYAIVFGLKDTVISKIGVEELEKPCDGLVGRTGAASPLAPGLRKAL
ncbi:hypothetical protein FKW77_004513 [Venturia effusa]|uniref:Carboxylic ester hydrolase n=1 Tax=Venturia effusa TaxID=50376 RepID=A0A517LQ58_9PEZI|nr:hypothetical protein FKW77_004513 [Venturia effusa]